MNYLDIVILILSLYGLSKGFSNGIITETSNLISVFLAIYIGVHFSELIYPYLSLNILSDYSNLIPLDCRNVLIRELDLVDIEGKPYYWINNNRLYNAKTGNIKNRITEKEAISIAQDNLIEELILDHVEYLTETNSHHEYRGQSLPAYAIHYKHKDLLVAYVDAKSGIFKKVRHQSWRWFDFLWMGHTMDYQGRDNFNNILLRIFSLFGVFTVLSGFVLWGTSSTTIIKFLNRNS